MKADRGNDYYGSEGTRLRSESDIASAKSHAGPGNGVRMDFKNKVVVVTGGAQGIGEALAHAFAAEGARDVVVADLNGERGAKVAQELGGRAFQVDVTDEHSLSNMIAQVDNECGTDRKS